MLRAVGRVLVLVAVILSGGLLTGRSASRYCCGTYLFLISVCMRSPGMMWLPVEKTPERTRLFLYEKPPRTSRFAWPVWSSVQDDLQSFNNTHKQTQEVRESDVTIEKLGKVFETRCNSLYASFKGQLISTEEGYLPDKFSGYELALVQVLTRHGDRAPLKGIPLADLSSFQCPDDKHYFADADTAMKTSNKCSRGRLTWNGCRQHETLGQHLKSIYHLDTKSIRSRTMVVSTDYQRTIQSAKCLIGGLLGHQNYRPIWKLPGTMFQMEKTGYLPNCPSIDVLWQETQKRTEFLHAKQKWYNIKTKLKQFFSQINRRLRSNQGPIEFYEGLICNYCQLNSSERSRMVTPCIKGHCLPPSLGEEIIKTADIYTKLHNQEKVSRATPFGMTMIPNCFV